MAANQVKNNNQIKDGVAGGGDILAEISPRRNVWGGLFCVICDVEVCDKN